MNTIPLLCGIAHVKVSSFMIHDYLRFRFGFFVFRCEWISFLIFADLIYPFSFGRFGSFCALSLTKAHISTRNKHQNYWLLLLNFERYTHLSLVRYRFVCLARPFVTLTNFKDRFSRLSTLSIMEHRFECSWLLNSSGR